MYWEETEEEIPCVGSLEIVETGWADEESEVTIKLNMPLSKWNLISRTKAWEEVCKMIEEDKVKRVSRIGFT